VVENSRMPLNARGFDPLLQGMPARSVCPIGSLFEADQMDSAARRQLLEIGEHLTLPEWLEHSIVADVEHTRTHARSASLPITSATDERHPGIARPKSRRNLLESSVEFRGRSALVGQSSLLIGSTAAVFSPRSRR